MVVGWNIMRLTVVLVMVLKRQQTIVASSDKTNVIMAFLYEEHDCCNSCEDVGEAYRKKGWGVTNPDLIDQSLSGLCAVCLFGMMWGSNLDICFQEFLVSNFELMISVNEKVSYKE
ncbi:hypothetical protein Rs2_44330 [Raphanus sativus]|nr:hypothetical protein Rs2_44330 [Raphanus sativus]